MAICRNATDLKHYLAQCIKSIETVMDFVTDSNYDKFDVSITQRRDVDPIYEPSHASWGNATGFKQKSGVELEIKIVDNRKKGQVL
ncbi:MAG: hypothetical protein IMZ64_02320 [Bacteroidetes bacterium]|nr:hypothetical protein [Bacteroidota bacterium]